MLRLNKTLIPLPLVFSFFLTAGTFCFADSPVTNEELLAELRSLKRTVQEQADKIRTLEDRILKQETGARVPGSPAIISEIDKRLDERLSQRAPGYQLTEGLSVGVEVTTIAQGVRNANGASQLSKREDETDANMTARVSLEKEFGDAGEGYVLLKAAPGAGVDRSLQLYGNVNNNAIDNANVYMPEAWYEQYFKPFSGALTIGKLDATNYIDTNEYANLDTMQFLSGIFGNSPVIEFPSNNAAGVHFGMAPYDLFDINVIAEDGKGDWNNVFDAMFLAGQVNFKPKFAGRPGNYRFLAWRNGDSHTRWTDLSREKENGYGYGMSFDQELTDAIGVFARYGWQDPNVYLNGSSFSLERSWSIGPQFKGTAWSRPFDVTGVAFGQILPSRKYKNVNELQAKTESHLEWYYSYRVNENFSVSPDLQVIWQPYGKDAANGDQTIVVGGLRGEMVF